MRRFGLIIAAVVAVLVTGILPSCTKVKDIKLTSFGVESFTPKGLRSADAVLAVGIDNPAFAFTVTSLDGLLKYKGEEIASFSADTVRVDRKCVKIYDVPCSATLSDNVGLGKLLSIVRGNSMEGLTADVKASVKLRNGVGKTLTFKDLDIEKLSREQ